MDMYPAAIHLYPLYNDIEGIFGIVYSLAKYWDLKNLSLVIYCERS